MQNPFDPGFYCSDELRSFGFKAVGENVRIAKNCTVICPGNISIADNVRIDAFCSIIATGPMQLGSYIHIGAFCHLVARAGLTLEDFSGLSQRVSIYTASDDYSGRYMTNPTVPEEFTGTREMPIHIGRHAIVGSGAVLLPGADLGEGSAVGALSLVTRSVPEWTVVAGSPARKTSDRRKDLLALESEMMRKTLAA